MDPNATLQAFLTACDDYYSAMASSDAEAAAELKSEIDFHFNTLKEWFKLGGFPPNPRKLKKSFASSGS